MMPPNAPAAHSPADGVSWHLAHPLRDHLESVARLAATAASAFSAGDIAELAGLWHDLGKYRPAFQQYIRGTKGLEKSHQFAGAALAVDVLASHPASLPIAICIAGHHGGLPAWQVGDQPLRQRLGESAAQRQAFPELTESLALAPADLVARRLSSDASPLADLFRRLPQPDRAVFWELLTRFVFSALVDSDWTDTAEFHEPQLRPDRLARQAAQVGIIARLRARLDAYLDGLRVEATVVNEHRRSVLEACRAAAIQAPGIFDLCVPTGGGKTLASMAFALRHAERHGLRRVIVVLPYTSIIEQNAKTLRDILGSEHILEHHSNLDIDQRIAEAHGDPGAKRQYKLLSETWDAPVIVTTAVQFLETLHDHTPARLRKLHRVADSVVILDEAQNLPIHLLKPTLDSLRVLSRAFRVSLVACTATQPALAKTEQDGQPRERLGDRITAIIPDSRPLFRDLRRVRVAWPEPGRTTSWEELAERIYGLPRVLAIVHTTKDARRLAELLDEMPASDVIHLSARMIPAHRSRVLAEVRQRLTSPSNPCRVVATNLIEAGVDVDFPVVFKPLAGLDALAQAAGRCNREGRLGPSGGVLNVYLPPENCGPPKELLPALHTTQVLLGEHGGAIDLDDPVIFRTFFHRLYGVRQTDAKSIDGLRGTDTRGNPDGRFADFPEIARRYRMIDDQGRVSVIVPWLHANDEAQSAIRRIRAGFPAQDDLRRAQRYSVQVDRRVVGTWLADGSATASPYLPLPVITDHACENLYHERFGITPEAETGPTINSLIL